MKHKCEDCKHCDKEKLLCHPNSKDCKNEYAIEEKDLKEYSECDFYESNLTQGQQRCFK